MSKQRIVVVGNGMVGHKFIDNVVTSEHASRYQVITFSEEPRLAYDRVQLSKYFSGSSAEDLALTTESYYLDKGVNYVLSDKVVDLDFDNKEVITASGRREAYDQLVLATGSFPFVPPIPGNDQPHCLVYRTIEDLEHIIAYSKHAKTCAVIGGGLLGLEAAKAAFDRVGLYQIAQFQNWGHADFPVRRGTAAIRLRVYSCCGASKIACVAPCSTMWPLFIT